MAYAAEACCGDGHDALPDALDNMKLTLCHRGGGLGHSNLHVVKIDLRNSRGRITSLRLCRGSKRQRDRSEAGHDVNAVLGDGFVVAADDHVLGVQVPARPGQTFPEFLLERLGREKYIFRLDHSCLNVDIARTVQGVDFP